MVEFVIDSPHGEPWLPVLRKLVVNFGGLELLTYQWLDLLGGQSEVLKATNELFSRRVARVRALIVGTDALTGSDRVRGIELWDEALDIAQRRNAILHNPVMFGYKTADESGPPDFIGVPDLKSPLKNPKLLVVASLEDIRKLAQRATNCAMALHTLLRDLASRRPV